MTITKLLPRQDLPTPFGIDMSVDLGPFSASKWEALCKDPGVTPQEAADPNLLFFFFPSPSPFGIDFSLDHCKSPQQDVSWKDRAAAEWRLSVSSLCLGRKQM